MHTDGGRTARTDKWSGGGCCMAFIWSRKFPIKAYHGIGSGSGSGPRSAGILGRGGAEGIDSYTMFSYLCVTNEGGGAAVVVGWLVGSRTTRRFFPQSFQMFDDDKKKQDPPHDLHIHISGNFLHVFGGHTVRLSGKAASEQMYSTSITSIDDLLLLFYHPTTIYPSSKPPPETPYSAPHPHHHPLKNLNHAPATTTPSFAPPTLPIPSSKNASPKTPCSILVSSSSVTTSGVNSGWPCTVMNARGRYMPWMAQAGEEPRRWTGGDEGGKGG